MSKLEVYKEALAVYEQAISLSDRSDASIHIKRGNALFHLSRHQEALVAYEQVLQQGNSFEQNEAYKGKGTVLQALAEQAFEKAGYEDTLLPDYPEEEEIEL